MKLLTASLAALGLLIAAPALAQTGLGTLENNAVVVVGPDGAQSRTHFNADGTITTTGAMAGAGTWVIQGANLCVTAANMPQACAPHDPARAVGSSWTVPGPNGAQLTATLVAGH